MPGSSLVSVTHHTALGVGGSTPVHRGHHSPDSVTLPRVLWPTRGTAETSLLAINSGALPFPPPVNTTPLRKHHMKAHLVVSKPDRERIAPVHQNNKEQ